MTDKKPPLSAAELALEELTNALNLLKRIMPLHELATERVVQLATLVDEVRILLAENTDAGHPMTLVEGKISDLVNKADAPTILREHDSEIWRKGWHARASGYLIADDPYNGEPEHAPR